MGSTETTTYETLVWFQLRPPEGRRRLFTGAGAMLSPKEEAGMIAGAKD
ncbi:MAG: hypothetical protein ACKO4Q_05015 [Planctomycetota bacterium]